MHDTNRKKKHYRYLDTEVLVTAKVTVRLIQRVFPLQIQPNWRFFLTIVPVYHFRQIHYPPETANIMLLVRILAYIQQHSDPESAAATIKQFCHRTVNEDAELVHKLLGDEFRSQINTLREMTANVINGEYVQEVCDYDSNKCYGFRNETLYIAHKCILLL